MLYLNYFSYITQVKQFETEEKDLKFFLNSYAKKVMERRRLKQEILELKQKSVNDLSKNYPAAALTDELIECLKNTFKKNNIEVKDTDDKFAENFKVAELAFGIINDFFKSEEKLIAILNE